MSNSSHCGIGGGAGERWGGGGASPPGCMPYYQLNVSRFLINCGAALQLLYQTIITTVSRVLSPNHFQNIYFSLIYSPSCPRPCHSFQVLFKCGATGRVPLWKIITFVNEDNLTGAHLHLAALAKTIYLIKIPKSQTPVLLNNLFVCFLDRVKVRQRRRRWRNFQRQSFVLRHFSFHLVATQTLAGVENHFVWLSSTTLRLKECVIGDEDASHGAVQCLF